MFKCFAFLRGPSVKFLHMSACLNVAHYVFVKLICVLLWNHRMNPRRLLTFPPRLLAGPRAGAAGVPVSTVIWSRKWRTHVLLLYLLCMLTIHQAHFHLPLSVPLSSHISWTSDEHKPTVKSIIIWGVTPCSLVTLTLRRNAPAPSSRFKGKAVSVSRRHRAHCVAVAFQSRISEVLCSNLSRSTN
jgi:hypothetical protein